MVDLRRAARQPPPRGMSHLDGAAGVISALLSQPDDVPLRVCDQREAHPRRLPRFLHHPAELTVLCGERDARYPGKGLIADEPSH